MSRFSIAILSRERVYKFHLQTYRKIIFRYGFEPITTVFVQTEDDLEVYTQAFPRVCVILRPGVGQAAAQEAIRSYYPVGENVVVMHDDITRVVRFKDGLTRRFDDVPRLFESAFDVMNEYGVTLGGFAPTTNAIFETKTAKKVSLDLRFIYDPLHLEVITNEAVEVQTLLKHDTERSIHHYRRSGGVLRLNEFGVSSFHRPDPRSQETDRNQTEMLKELFPREIHSIRVHKGGYRSAVLKALPYHGPMVAVKPVEKCEDDACTRFHLLLGNYDVVPDMETAGGRLLCSCHRLGQLRGFLHSRLACAGTSC
jgi:hypothetical protein